MKHQYIVGRIYSSWVWKNVGTSRDQEAKRG